MEEAEQQQLRVSIWQGWMVPHHFDFFDKLFHRVSVLFQVVSTVEHLNGNIHISAAS